MATLADILAQPPVDLGGASLLAQPPVDSGGVSLLPTPLEDSSGFPLDTTTLAAQAATGFAVDPEAQAAANQTSWWDSFTGGISKMFTSAGTAATKATVDLIATIIVLTIALVVFWWLFLRKA